MFSSLNRFFLGSSIDEVDDDDDVVDEVEVDDDAVDDDVGSSRGMIPLFII